MITVTCGGRDLGIQIRYKTDKVLSTGPSHHLSNWPTVSLKPTPYKSMVENEIGRVLTAIIKGTLYRT
jgi:hypothetical protein